MQELTEANGSIQHLLSQLQVLVNTYGRSDLDPAVVKDWWDKYIALSIKLRRPAKLSQKLLDVVSDSKDRAPALEQQIVKVWSSTAAQRQLASLIDNKTAAPGATGHRTAGKRGSAALHYGHAVHRTGKAAAAGGGVSTEKRSANKYRRLRPPAAVGEAPSTPPNYGGARTSESVPWIPRTTTTGIAAGANALPPNPPPEEPSSPISVASLDSAAIFGLPLPDPPGGPGNPLEIDSANGEEVVFVVDNRIYIDSEGIVHKPEGTTWPEVDKHFETHDLDGNPRDPSDDSADGEWSSDDDTTTGTTSNVHVVTAVNVD